jgi:formylglycine-generating enzyme required for sulfatase activity
MKKYFEKLKKTPVYVQIATIATILAVATIMIGEIVVALIFAPALHYLVYETAGDSRNEYIYDTYETIVKLMQGGNPWKSGATIITLSRDSTLRVSSRFGISITYNQTPEISKKGSMKGYYYSDTEYYSQSIWHSPWRSNSFDITNVVIDNGVIEIGDYAFDRFQNMESVSIPNSVKYIGSHAFLGCLKLSSLTIPNGVRWINERAFKDCHNLFSVTIPQSVVNIGFGAFIDAAYINVAVGNPDYSSIDGVLFNKHKTLLIQYPRNKKDTAYIVPESVTSICSDAFNGCKLISLTVLKPIPPAAVSNSSFYSNSIACLYVPKGSIDTYRVAEGWKEIESIEVMTKDVTVTAVSEKVSVKKDLAIAMVSVQGGTFTMGYITFRVGEKSMPRRVTIDNFQISKYPVTQKLWKEVMGVDNNPSHFGGDDLLPVERVSWNDVQQFITKLNELTGKEYRLPTEEEWEYAARGGSKSKGYKYSGGNNIDDVAWYYSNSDGKTQMVGTKQPNELGIHDMSGNVFEWVNDVYGGTLYVVRGGDWFSDDVMVCRVYFRNAVDSGQRLHNVGFRLALSP